MELVHEAIYYLVDTDGKPTAVQVNWVLSANLPGPV